ncbi:MAG: diguanylate cyclase, partial [Chloroflexota bacterium]
VRDTRRDPDYVAPYRPRLSELCVPIQHGGEVWGVINLEDNEPDAFDENDLESVQTIADGLALALEGVRLLEEERRARLQAETL